MRPGVSPHVAIGHVEERGLSALSSEELEAALDADRVPRHVAIVMDGNGRWAQRRSLPRIQGHRAAIDSVWEIVEECGRVGVDILTLYAFSTENWRRPADEVRSLMSLLRTQLRVQTPRLHRNNVRLRAIGEVERLPRPVRRELHRAIGQLASNTGLVLNLALSYGARQELVKAVRRLVADVQTGELRPDDITEDTLAAYLDTAPLPDPDLVIRTSGEMRLSNFLLWQSAYAEFCFTPVLWPDFRRRHLLEAIVAYQRRERRFGGIGKSRPDSPDANGS
jgi:undecaprenyl diphosphate synthase